LNRLLKYPPHIVALGIFLALTGSALAATVTGVVTNGTNNKPSAGDKVTLLQLAQGMQELAHASTDNKGRFSINVPDDGLHLLRVTHEGANYFKPIQAGTQSVEIEVYSAAAKVAGVTLDADVMRIESEATGGLRVVEHFFVKNSSQPPMTLFSEHPFELYLPAGAVVEGSAAKAPGGMAVQSALVPGSEPNRFTILFPIRPGETEFQVSYKLPYTGSLTFQPRPIMTTDNLVVMLPKSMTFKPGNGTPYSPVTEELGAQTYVARSAEPSQPLGFTLSGTGQLPRDTTAAGAGGGAGASGNQQASTGGDPNTDTRPGGGLGVPVDKDAVRDPWTKYRWWILAGFGLLLAGATGFLLTGPQSGRQRGSAAAGNESFAGNVNLPRGPDTILQTLRDEMFAVETDRLEGRLSPEQYAELKSAFDVVLRRALARSAAAAATASAAIAGNAATGNSQEGVLG
jgi:hypothetical protein